MKRVFDPLTGVHKIGPKTSDNSTSTGSHMKRMKRDGSRPKHLRRGASHASSAQEFMKSEWTCDELDLNKQIASLTDLAQDKFKLVEELFSIFSILELKEFTPDILKEYSINQLKELCIEELNTISMAKIKFMTEGNDPHDYVETEANIDDKAIGDTSDGIQLSVDDNEYSDFLGAENLEPRRSKKEMKDAEVQANWSSLESSSSDESHSDHKDGEGWMNLWKLEQMEILELEMRARAIRMLLKQQEEGEGSAQNTIEDDKISKLRHCLQNTSDNNLNELEAGEIADNDEVNSNNNEYNEDIENVNDNEDSNTDKRSVDNSDEEQENSSSKVQSFEDNECIIKEDNNNESNIEKNDDKSDSEVDIENIERKESEDEKNDQNIEQIVETPKEITANEEIILVNEEFDEELDEENFEEEDNQTSDRQSVASDKSDIN